MPKKVTFLWMDSQSFLFLLRWKMIHLGCLLVSSLLHLNLINVLMFTFLLVGMEIRHQDKVKGIRNLQFERIIVIWKHRPKDNGHPIAMHCYNRKQKEKAKHNASCDNGMFQFYTRTKHKCERVIKDSCGDPHTFRLPQRRALY